MGIGYILLSDPMLTPVLDEVLSSLVPLCHKWSESVSQVEGLIPFLLKKSPRFEALAWQGFEGFGQNMPKAFAKQQFCKSEGIYYILSYIS